MNVSSRTPGFRKQSTKVAVDSCAEWVDTEDTGALLPLSSLISISRMYLPTYQSGAAENDSADDVTISDISAALYMEQVRDILVSNKHARLYQDLDTIHRSGPRRVVAPDDMAALR